MNSYLNSSKLYFNSFDSAICCFASLLTRTKLLLSIRKAAAAPTAENKQKRYIDISQNKMK